MTNNRFAVSICLVVLFSAPAMTAMGWCCDTTTRQDSGSLRDASDSDANDRGASDRGVPEIIEEIEEVDRLSPKRMKLTEELLAVAMRQQVKDLQFKALVVAAQSYGASRQSDKMDEVVQKATALLPRPNCKDFEARLELYQGHLMVLQLKYIPAVHQTRKAIASNRLDPQHLSMAHNTLGVSCARVGLLDSAAEEYEQAAIFAKQAGADFGWRSAVNNMAFMLVQTGEYEEAKRRYDSLCPVAPDERLFVHVMLGLAEVNLGLGKHDKALEIVLEALEKFSPPSNLTDDPRLALLENLAARCFEAGGDPHQAKAYAKKALKNFPATSNRKPEAEFVLALSEASLGNRELAIESINKIIEAPLDKLFELKVTKKLAELYSQVEDYEQAYLQAKLAEKLSSEISKKELAARMSINSAKYASKLKVTQLEMEAEKEKARTEKAELLAAAASKKAKAERMIRNGVLALAFLTMLGFTIYLWSATKHRKTNELLRQANEKAELEKLLAKKKRIEAIGELSGSVTHDFNNILQVLAQTNFLLRSSLGDEIKDEQLALFDSFDDAVGVGSNITSQLLSFAKHGHGAPKVKTVSRLFDSAEFLFAAVGSNEIGLEFEYEDRNLAINVDPSQFSNAILNLLLNSKDAMENGRGTIKISVSPFEPLLNSARPDGLAPGPYVRIDVSDNGSGMSREQMERAFEPFYTTKADAVGTGVGLNSVRSFVERSEGAVWIESELGTGTTISMVFPRYEVDAASSDTFVDSMVDASIASSSCLIVEDNHLVRQTLIKMMEVNGFECDSCESADEARVLLEAGAAYAVILTDVRMPGDWDGIDLANWLRSEHPSTSVIVLSGNEGGRDLEDFIFLRKPFQIADLKAALNSIGQQASKVGSQASK